MLRLPLLVAVGVLSLLLAYLATDALFAWALSHSLADLARAACLGAAGIACLGISVEATDQRARQLTEGGA